MGRMIMRSPNIFIGVVIFFALLLFYRLWVLTSEKDDLRKEVNKLVEDLQLSSMTISQLEQKIKHQDTLLQESKKNIEAANEKTKWESHELQKLKLENLNQKNEMTFLKEETNGYKMREQSFIKRLSLKEKDLELIQEKLLEAEHHKSEMEDAFVVKEKEVAELKKTIQELNKKIKYEKTRDKGALNDPGTASDFGVAKHLDESKRAQKIGPQLPLPSNGHDGLNENHVIPVPPDNEKLQQINQPQDLLQHQIQLPNANGHNLDAADDDMGKDQGEVGDDADADGEVRDDAEPNYDREENPDGPYFDKAEAPSNFHKEPRGIGAAALPRLPAAYSAPRDADEANFVDDAARKGNERLSDTDINDKISQLHRDT